MSPTKTKKPTVFIPPKTTSASAQKKSTSTRNKQKPPTYIVIGGKHPKTMEMPMHMSMQHHHSATELTAGLDESFNTMHHLHSSSPSIFHTAPTPASRNHSRSHSHKQEQEEDEDDVNYIWSSVSEASSVSSTSLQEFMEWKIFGKQEQQQDNHKHTHNKHKEIPLSPASPTRSSRRSFQNPNSCYRPPLKSDNSGTITSNSMLSAPVTMPDEMVFGTTASTTASPTTKARQQDDRYYPTAAESPSHTSSRPCSSSIII